MSSIDAEFLIEIGEKYLKGDGLPQSTGIAVEMFSTAQVVGEQNPNCDGPSLSFLISKTILERFERIRWESEGELEWGFDKKDGLLILKGKGPLEDYADGRKTCKTRDYGIFDDVPWRKKYKDQIQSAVACYGVSSIGRNAFYNCPSLESVVIPGSVASIGRCAIDSCSSLTSVTFLKSVKTIGNFAFYYCTRLKTISVPKGIGLPFNSFPRSAKINKY